MTHLRRAFVQIPVALLGLTVPLAAAATPYAYPLRLSQNARYLVDQNDQPFLIQGDSPWSLIVQLTLAEGEQYLEDRRQKGFNLAMVNLIEHQFCANPPFNRNGDAPFLVPGDFTQPSEAYFAFADQMIALAAQKNICVLLCPAYLGYGGGNEGWYQEELAAGPAAMRQYGRYVGNRYRNFDNIIWLVGGDFSPPRPTGTDLVDQLALGILDFDDRHLMTAHCSPYDSPIDIYPAETWLDINNTYSYWDALYESVLEDYNRPNFRAFFMLESAYENDFLAAPRQRVRRQAWWSNLCGTTGQLYGDNPIWFFGGGWQAALNAPGAQDMARVDRLFRTLPWWTLVPDQTHQVITAGYGSLGSTNYATTAARTDGTLSVTYIPPTGLGARTLTANLSQFGGPVWAQWYNVVSSAYTMVAGSPFANSGPRNFTSASNNGAGQNDAVLLLWTHPPCALPGDMNCDCVLDASDTAAFLAALTAPDVPAATTGCRSADTDGDGDADLRDVSAVQVAAS